MLNLRSATQLGTARERVHAMDPSLAADAPRHMAGVLLLALQESQPRVDLLAARLKLPREFVAKCLRRLVDNGVIQNGALVTGWSGDTWSEEAFWADVKVALGTWWRRQDGAGRLEWIEAGAWQKPYEYVDRGTGYLADAEAQPRMNLDLLTVSTDSHWIGSLGQDAGGFLPTGEDGFEAPEPAWVGGFEAEDGEDADALEAAVAPAGGEQSVVWLF